MGRSVIEVPGVRAGLARLKRRERYRRTRAVKGAPGARRRYLAQYRHLKRELEVGLLVYPVQHQRLNGLFHRLSPAQQAECRGRSPGCLFTCGDGPEGHY